MNINKTDLDSLNSVINMTIDRKDYEEKVSAVLSNYRKNANIPGFRKGHVPMGMIKKQYEQAVIADEVNKLLRENLDNYIKDEKLELLGNPIPKPPKEALNWKDPQLTFEFELGMAPKFDVKLGVLKKIIRSKFFITIFRWIHPTIAYKIAKFISRSGKEDMHEAGFNKDVKNELQNFAENQFRNGFDYMISGHYHLSEIYSLDKGKLAVLGDWFHRPSYAKFDGKDLSLLQWEEDV